MKYKHKGLQEEYSWIAQGRKRSVCLDQSDGSWGIDFNLFIQNILGVPTIS